MVEGKESVAILRDGVKTGEPTDFRVLDKFRIRIAASVRRSAVDIVTSSQCIE